MAAAFDCDRYVDAALTCVKYVDAAVADVRNAAAAACVTYVDDASVRVRKVGLLAKRDTASPRVTKVALAESIVRNALVSDVLLERVMRLVTIALVAYVAAALSCDKYVDDADDCERYVDAANDAVRKFAAVL